MGILGQLVRNLGPVAILVLNRRSVGARQVNDEWVCSRRHEHRHRRERQVDPDSHFVRRRENVRRVHRYGR
jgi:hypothetical protein